MEKERTIEMLQEGNKTPEDLLALERKRIKEIIQLKKERNKCRLREKETVKCPECGSALLKHDYIRAEVICQECGIVIEDKMIDPGPEWRAFDEEQKTKRARTGPPATVLRHDNGMPTYIDWRNRDSKGNSLSQVQIRDFARLRKWQKRIGTRGPKERNLRLALSEMGRMISALALPKSVYEEAAVIYRKAHDANLIRGRSTEDIVSASIYAACREQSIPRTLDEIAKASRSKKVSIGRAYRILSRELKLEARQASALDYLPRFCSALKFDDNSVETRAAEMIRQIINDTNSFANGRAKAIASAAIYQAGKDLGGRNFRVQHEVAEVAGVTTVTIRNTLKDLKKESESEEADNGLSSGSMASEAPVLTEMETSA